MFSLELLPFTVAISCMSPGSVRVLPTVTTATFVGAVIVVLTGRLSEPQSTAKQLLQEWVYSGQMVITLYNIPRSVGFRDVCHVGLEGWFLG